MAQQPSASGSLEKTETDASKSSETSKSDENKPENRRETATKLVERFAMWSGAAGLIPVPGVDLLTVGAVQLQMLRRLSQIYDVPFSDNRGKAIIASLAGSAIPATSGIGAATLLKSVPVVGTAIATFVMPTLSAGFTYAIGKAFIQHFESGGTLLDFNPPDYRAFLRAQKEMWDKRKSKSDKTAKADSTAPAASTSS